MAKMNREGQKEQLRQRNKLSWEAITSDLGLDAGPRGRGADCRRVDPRLSLGCSGSEQH